MSHNDLKGLRALVTGASRGIGRACAEILAERGAEVIGTATTDDGAGAIRERLSDKGGDGRTLDVSSDDDTARFVEKFLADFDAPPEILVNNAGITRDNLFVRMRPEQWREVIDTNLGSMYRMSSLLGRHMLKKCRDRGRIINISSIVGSIGNIGQVNYAASKAGVEGFTKALALEFASRGVTVNSVAPGFIETDMTAALDEDTRAKMLAAVPLNRFGSPLEVAELVAFLASEESAYITGATLHINGGMHMP